MGGRARRAPEVGTWRPPPGAGAPVPEPDGAARRDVALARGAPGRAPAAALGGQALGSAAAGGGRRARPAEGRHGAASGAQRRRGSAAGPRGSVRRGRGRPGARVTWAAPRGRRRGPFFPFHRCFVQSGGSGSNVPRGHLGFPLSSSPGLLSRASRAAVLRLLRPPRSHPAFPMASATEALGPVPGLLQCSAPQAQVRPRPRLPGSGQLGDPVLPEEPRARVALRCPRVTAPSDPRCAWGPLSKMSLFPGTPVEFFLLNWLKLLLHVGSSGDSEPFFPLTPPSPLYGAFHIFVA